MDTIPIDRHNKEIHENLKHWNRKPILRLIYRTFYEQISAATVSPESGITVELGSGIGNIKEVLPNCLRTDLFNNQWIDQCENAYALSFADQSVANIILFDVFHHLRYPGRAFKEFERVLVPGGRVIVFDPCVSALGMIVYGLFHHEPLALTSAITWNTPEGWTPVNDSYYAAQGNAYRIFFHGDMTKLLPNWKLVKRQRMSALSYIASGGYSKPQLFPEAALSVVRWIEGLCDALPVLCATRVLVALEIQRKNSSL